MRKKIYDILTKIYGLTMTIAFFAGILPLFPFIYAIAVGGETAEKISIFLYDGYYPWVIALACISVIIGLVAMYVGGKKGLSVNDMNSK